MTIFRGAGGGGNVTTDTELTALTALSAAATASAASASTSASSATASASAAAISASAAATSASGGSTSASAAATSASAASTSATNAAASASSAAASASSIDPTTFVKLTTAQTIADVKTFTSTIVGAVSGNAGSATTLAAGADRTKLDAITGTNTGDETLASIKTKLGITTLSGSNTGDQTNISGNAATVTTNANLTGAITSSGNATSLGSFSSVALSGALTDETGTGVAVFATNPVLVAPALGTPSALVGTNITGVATSFTASNVTTNANLTGVVTSVGNATSLGSMTSAQLAAAITDETGTGQNVFATGPTLVAPILGTPASGVVTNLTGTASININGTVGATTTAAGKFTTLQASSMNGGQLAGLRNRIINGGFSINQRAVSGTVTLTAGSYGHDRFKAGASGCTYTFAASQNGNVLTITAGSLMQVIEGANLEGGTFVLSWFGTTTGRIDSGTFSASGVTGTAVAATNQTVEFGTGTVGRVQYELGTVATTFEQRPIGMEMSLCQRYYSIKTAVVTASSIYLTQIHFAPMRVTPTIGTVVFDAGTGATFSNTNPGGTVFQSANHSQIATATSIPLSAEL